jgi:hypothetical protein
LSDDEPTLSESTTAGTGSTTELLASAVRRGLACTTAQPTGGACPPAPPGGRDEGPPPTHGRPDHEDSGRRSRPPGTRDPGRAAAARRSWCHRTDGGPMSTQPSLTAPAGARTVGRASDGRRWMTWI